MKRNKKTFFYCQKEAQEKKWRIVEVFCFVLHLFLSLSLNFISILGEFLTILKEKRMLKEKRKKKWTLALPDK